MDRAAAELFEEHKEWAASVGRKIHRKLPPSFAVDDLEQKAVIAHWHCVEAFDASKGVPYHGYAYLTVRGAVLMSCRRKAYREATHQPLEFDEPNGRGHSGGATGSGDKARNVPVDQRPRADQELLAREEQRRLAGSQLYVQRLRLLMAVSRLPAEERDVVRQVLDGADIEEVDSVTPGAKRRLAAAVRKLKRELVPTVRPAVVKPAATLPREKLPAALPTMPEADAYLVRRVNLEGQSVAALAAVWGVEPAHLESRRDVGSIAEPK